MTNAAPCASLETALKIAMSQPHRTPTALATEAALCSPLAPPALGAGETAQVWSRLYGAARSAAVAAAAQAEQRPFIYFARDVASAARIEQELEFFAPELPRYHLTDWETLPYDRFSPYQDIISERIATLSQLPTLTAGVTIVAIQTALHRLPPRAWLGGRAFTLRRGDTLDRDDFRRQLEAAGYRAGTQVTEHGDYAVRGSLIDVFPMGAEVPFRLDLFDDEIETVRVFDIETQRSIEEIEMIEILPGREFPLDSAAIREFRRAWRLEFEGAGAQAAIYDDISEGLAPASSITCRCFSTSWQACSTTSPKTAAC